jgi:lycopene beta-cyclase
VSPQQRADPPRADVLLAGAGLANSLIALRLKARRPDLRVVAFDPRPPGERDAHTWSFFTTDVAPEVLAWLAPLAAHRWDDYEVRFPRHARRLRAPYAAVTGPGLQAAVRAALGEDLKLGVRVSALTPDSLTLADGETWRAPLVVDGRGARASNTMSLAWQKFLGLEIVTAAPHGVTRPVIMDAGVEQIDGFRFVYLLPFDATTLLVEDTYYSASAHLDVGVVEGRVRAYAAGRGWEIAAVRRRESGVLPITLGGDIEAFMAENAQGLPCTGLRAPLFHPVTGYSLPEAAGLAHVLAEAPVLESGAVDALVRTRVRSRWKAGGFLRALNRMMFLAAEPSRRYRVLERFYSLPEPLIERFYAGSPTWADRARLLVGEPPVPITRALRALPAGAALRAAL